MDMEFTEEQQALQKTARSFLATECPLSVAREMESSDEGFPQELWKKMADLGWLGLPHSEELGGSGMGNVELVVLTKELGRTLCPSPYIQTVILAGGAIAAAASAEQKQRLLSGIIAGETVVAFALQEENTFYDARSVRATAIANGDDRHEDVRRVRDGRRPRARRRAYGWRAAGDRRAGDVPGRPQ